jgi:hypothetical protein
MISIRKAAATYLHNGREFINIGCPVVNRRRCCAIADVAAHFHAGRSRRAGEIQDCKCLRFHASSNPGVARIDRQDRPS